jgi:predicted amidophosphoribosyltransferase
MEEEAEDQVCSRCGMPALVLHNGLLVCEACGTQAEVLILSLSLLAAKNFHLLI